MVLMILIMAITFVTVSIISASEAFAITGEGTEQDPYKIASAQDWDNFAARVRSGNTDGYYKLMNDITIESTAGTGNNPFTGHFDGNSRRSQVSAR